MKKFVVAILAVIYLFVSTGVAFNIHYCMGKVASVDFIQHSDKCNKCGMKIKGGCCKDEFKIVKLSDSHQLTAHETGIFSPFAIIDNSKSFLDSDIVGVYVSSDLKNHSPPVSQDIPLCILNSIFRI
jgi:hypothetical protein